MKTPITKEIEHKFIEFLYEKKYEMAIKECSIGLGGKYGIVDVLSYHGKNVRNGRGKPNTREVTWKCYEIKTSKGDFYSKHKLTFVGDYNYFVVPEDLYPIIEKDIPEGIGCFVYNGFSFSVKKKAKRKKRTISDSQLNHDFIVSLARDARRWDKNVYKILTSKGI